jgi:hypothetical protein
MIKIPKAADLAREVESLEHSVNQKALAKIVSMLETAKKSRTRSVQYTEDLPEPVQKELRAAGYRVEYFYDQRENESWWSITF